MTEREFEHFQDGIARALVAVLDDGADHVVVAAALAPAARHGASFEHLDSLARFLAACTRDRVNTEQDLVWWSFIAADLAIWGQRKAPSKARRTTGSHYTPRSLVEKVVARTADPLLRCLADPVHESILDLRICDPAMGGGAFLLGVVDYLAEHLRGAWERAGLDLGDGAQLTARRMVASQCIRGVDKNAQAVPLAKLAVWLFVEANASLDDYLGLSLKHGDALVGLSLEQIAAFDWEARA